MEFYLFVWLLYSLVSKKNAQKGHVGSPIAPCFLKVQVIRSRRRGNGRKVVKKLPVISKVSTRDAGHTVIAVYIIVCDIRAGW